MTETVTQRNSYSVSELADMRLPGFPTTRQNWYPRVKGWEFVERRGRGPAGVVRAYIPPPEVLALIKAQEGVERPDGPMRATARQAPTAPGLAQAEEPGTLSRQEGPAPDEAPFDSQKELLEAVLRVMEYKFRKGQVPPETVDLALEMCAAWLPISAEYPELEARIKAMASAYAFLKSGGGS
ncbi:hypothetical protein [Accumulibacter sp.]|uniref:hypothetical protein n=1 Tax=Accumulibacter sp. TaxID=2053492 RepID=UPI002639BF26|nr:hypothetical protein [Accumulibacter sp.]